MRSALRAMDAMDTGAQVMEAVSSLHPPRRLSAAGPAFEDWIDDCRGRICLDGGDCSAEEELIARRVQRCSAAASTWRRCDQRTGFSSSERTNERASLCVEFSSTSKIETILHYTCRDRNVLSIQSDLLEPLPSASKIFCVLRAILKAGELPDATAVFDVDAIGLVSIVRNLNCGLDIGKNSIGESTGFTISVAANPGVPDIEQEVRRFAYKVESWGGVAITQPVFDLRVLEEFLRRIEGFRIPVIAGIWPLTSLRNAEFMKNDLRLAVPDGVMTRMAEASSPEAARAEGFSLPRRCWPRARPMVQGVQVSAPFGKDKYVAAARVLGLTEGVGV